ncbi:MAG: hypothetical protein WB439_15465 [Acidobacteriaceae bacterium]
MIDIQPPEHTPHTWKDFFIHIATIVVGLIIAVGLEQTIELIHHHHQITETREALHHERLENYARLQNYVKLFRQSSASQQADMAILISLQHPSPNASLATNHLHWAIARNQFETSAWQTAQSSGVLTLMPPAEVLANQNIYTALHDISNQNELEWLALNDAVRFTFSTPHAADLTPAQLTEEITLMQKLMTRQYLRGNFMGYPHHLDPNFTPGPSELDQATFHHFIDTTHDTPVSH